MDLSVGGPEGHEGPEGRAHHQFFVFTSKVPLGRLCRIDDVVSFVKFLTVDGDYCTGQAFNVTGGREMH